MKEVLIKIKPTHADTVAAELISVQPMAGPIGTVFDLHHLTLEPTVLHGLNISVKLKEMRAEGLAPGLCKTLAKETHLIYNRLEGFVEIHSRFRNGWKDFKWTDEDFERIYRVVFTPEQLEEIVSKDTNLLDTCQAKDEG